MTHQQHLNLIKNAIPNRAGVWADLGSGAGAFALATADLLPFGSKIYSIDQNSLSIQSQEAEFERLFPSFPITFHTADFTKKLPINEKLDGIIMANSLHFVKEKISVLKKLKELLKPSGRIVFVEYNVDKGNQWVPYPFSFDSLIKLAKESGFGQPVLAGRVKSQFLNEMYCAYLLGPD